MIPGLGRPADAHFLSLCALLRPADGPVPAALDHPGDREDAWIAVAGLANSQRVSGYLHAALTQRRSRTPFGFGDYALVVAEANARRNMAIIDQLIEIGRCLNAAGIIPMAIKGAAFLLDTNGAVSNRMPLDLDIMVEERHFGAAIAALMAAGYCLSEAEDNRAHAQNLFHPERPMPVDVHRTFGRQRSLVPSSEVWMDAVPAASHTVRLLLPSPAHRLFHAIFHADLQNRFHSLGHISLQLMLDIAELLTRYPAMDIRAVENLFEAKGFGHIFSSAMYAAHATVGAPGPAWSACETARRHYRRCLLQLRYPLVHRLVGGAWMLGHPFGRFKVGYSYFCEDDNLRLNLARLILPIRLIQKHRRNFFSKVALSWADLSAKLS